MRAGGTVLFDTRDQFSAISAANGVSPNTDRLRAIRKASRHLVTIGAWSEERHVQAEAEILDTVVAAQKQAETFGTLHSGSKPSARDMFEDVYAELPPHLRRQRQEVGV